ncbi:hypothetical protein N7527_001254 [Penicillium freii]|nr:hypothetical protein N7527_001254 [Penicillium freii]
MVPLLHALCLASKPNSRLRWAMPTTTGLDVTTLIPTICIHDMVSHSVTNILGFSQIDSVARYFAINKITMTSFRRKLARAVDALCLRRFFIGKYHVDHRADSDVSDSLRNGRSRVLRGVACECHRGYRPWMLATE